MLGPMYAGYFGLQLDPFTLSPDPRFLYMSERHREALAHLLYGVRGGGGFVVLSGDIGAGKTTICRCFLQQVPPDCRVAYIFHPPATALDLLQSICKEFGVGWTAQPGNPGSLQPCIDALNAHLLRSHAAGERNLLIIDEAQALPAPVLEQLRLLTNLETSEAKLLQIVLIGQPELRQRLAEPGLEQLAQRVVARCHLDTLGPEEVRPYVAHRLQVAGLTGPLPFTDEAIDRIHALTGGVPRRINLLCDRALLGAYGGARAQVDRTTLERAASEVFDTPAPPPASPPTAAAASTAPRVPWSRPVLALSALAAAAVLVTVLQAWTHRNGTAAPSASSIPSVPATPAPAPAAPTSTPAGAAPAAGPQAAAEAWPGTPPWPRLEADPGWQQLGQLWGARLAPRNPCGSARLEGLQCYRTERLTLAGLKQLDRPGLITLSHPGGSTTVLVIGLNDAEATVAAGDRVWRLPLEQLDSMWRGDFGTLWRLPPGQRTRLEDGRFGPAAPWLAERLADLQTRGLQVERGASLTEQVKAFQRSQGIDPVGAAGPLTFMQLNRASRVDEPRLGQTPPSS
jgi:general secretion pathway protein A